MFLPLSVLLRFVAAAMFILAAAGAGFAQTKCQVTCPDGTRMPVKCDTQVDPCPLRDFATPPAFGSPEWRTAFGRFTDVLVRLRVQFPDLLKEQPVPVTYADLLRESGLMFEEAAFRLDSVNLRNRWVSDQLRALDKELQGLTSRDAQLHKRAADLPAQLAAAKADFARARRDAEQKRLPALSVQRAANAMRDRAKRAAQDCIYWLAITQPPGVTPLRENSLANRVTARQDVLVWAPVRPESAVLIAPMAPPVEEFSGVPVRRAQPAGSTADRLAAAEGLIPQLKDAQESLHANEATFTQKSALLAPARTTVALLLGKVMRQQGELNGLHASIAGLKTTDWKDLQKNQIVALGNLRRAAAEAFVVETYRDRVLVPEVRQFLSANRVSGTGTLDHAALVRNYETRTSLLNARKRDSFLELNRYVNVQVRTARILNDYRLYAPDAANAIGGDAIDQARAIRADIMQNLGGRRGDLLRGSERETGPLAKIARALLTQ
jgi:hypothetical protein